MATASTWLAQTRPRSPEGASADDQRSPGLLNEIRHGLALRRQRRVERLMAGLIERNGAHITDSVERAIGNRSLRG